MASILSRSSSKCLANIKNKSINLANQKNNVSSYTNVNNKRKILLATAGVVGAGTVGLIYSLHQSVKAMDIYCHPPDYPWPHYGFFKSFDHKAIRRGYEVYKQVCAACHSLRFVRYRELIGVSHTEDEARAEAEEIQVQDGPNEDGKMFMRPGKLSDAFPSPYPNEEAARAANNGAFPPDLSYIVLARHGYENYIFSLLTGYQETPAGLVIGEGQYFNPYFPGGAISMAQALYDEAVEYSDGTPPIASQLAKDVTTFLAWCAQPEHDKRKKLLIDSFIVLSTIGVALWYWKRHIGSSLKSRKILFRQSPSSSKPKN
ncbi:cytochrome c1 [Dermatophagoides farinae]|uniref:Cytochrome c1 n=1 Tax=Dermatophagoides farinae TaxID=6954 RepID=A0A922LBV6_DERFA|nr:cytochrome c1, heme protein, mitochondrial-like [Dermatophagoides farinae]KAH7636288.1 cytochrome c1 [Dermatophagoides farinae]KAH9528342.1 iso-1-cytochrome c [Dermatophagoides farinae]